MSSGHPSDPTPRPDPAALLAQCATAFALLDRDLRVRWHNPALLERVGAGAWRILGESLAVLDAAPPALTAAARRAGDEQRAVVLREAVLRQGVDGIFAADVGMMPIDGDRVLLEVHALGRRPEPAPARLSESLRGFAHEVRNPLAGVRGAAQLLQRRVGAPELAELAGLVIAEADRLAALADRLLHGGGSRPEACNVHAVLDRVAALVSAQAGAPEVRRDFDPSLPDVHADADRLFQLLLNLARNAVEAGARHLRLRSRAERGVVLAGRHRRLALRVDVCDDGAGVPADIADALFEPLVSGRADGSGLGLALAREIALEHGADLHFVSSPGATVFSLILPLED